MRVINKKGDQTKEQKGNNQQEQDASVKAASQPLAFGGVEEGSFAQGTLGEHGTRTDE